MALGFHEDLFPFCPSVAGSAGGPQRRTLIAMADQQSEKRKESWRDSRRRFSAALNLRPLDDLYRLVEFFEARRGKLYGFRWRDALDWKSCAPKQAPQATDQLLGFGDGIQREVQLVKGYLSGGAAYARTIYKPVTGSVVAAVSGAPAVVAVDSAMGLITFATPPANGARVTAGFLFHTPVRFDSDRLEVQLVSHRRGSATVPIIEIRP